MRHRNLIKITAGIIIVFIVVGYGLFRTKDLLLGPALTIKAPSSGATVNHELVVVTGEAKRISQIYINDRKIYTDGSNHFREPLLLAKGYNLIEVRAEDRFNRKIEKVVELVYKN